MGLVLVWLGGLLSSRIVHVGLGVLNSDAKFLGELFELLEILACSGSSSLVSLFEKLCAVLGDGIHDFFEILELFHFEVE